VHLGKWQKEEGRRRPISLLRFVVDLQGFLENAHGMLPLFTTCCAFSAHLGKKRKEGEDPFTICCGFAAAHGFWPIL
jgi:hypothetical protein